MEGQKAFTAVAQIPPSPGIVISGATSGPLGVRRRISFSGASMRSVRAVICSRSIRASARAVSGTVEVASSTAGATMPN